MICLIEVYFIILFLGLLKFLDYSKKESIFAEKFILIDNGIE